MFELIKYYKNAIERQNVQFYRVAVGDFSKILGRHELSRKNIHDFKRPMNQNLGYPSAAQMSARHFRKISSRAHVEFSN